MPADRGQFPPEQEKDGLADVIGQGWIVNLPPGG